MSLWVAHCIKGSKFRISKLRCTLAPEDIAFIIASSAEAVEMPHSDFNLAIIKNISVENSCEQSHQDPICLKI